MEARRATLLTTAQRGLDLDTALGHLLGFPAFTDPVRPGDRHWHSWPGTALTGLAFEPGYPQVLTRDSKVMRVGPDQAAALEAQRRSFEEKFGHPPGPDDPLLFDPDADEPQQLSLTGMETETVGMLEAAGICPAWIYAYQHTGGLLPRPDGSFASGGDQAEWDEVISRYVAVHQPGTARHGTTIDHQVETRKLQHIMTAMTLQMAADDPGYGRPWPRRWAGSAGGRGTDSALLREYLHACAGELGSALRADRAIGRRQESMPGPGAVPAWPGACKPPRAGAGDSIADDVLLATAVAIIQSPQA